MRRWLLVGWQILFCLYSVSWPNIIRLFSIVNTKYLCGRIKWSGYHYSEINRFLMLQNLPYIFRIRKPTCFFLHFILPYFPPTNEVMNALVIYVNIVRKKIHSSIFRVKISVLKPKIWHLHFHRIRKKLFVIYF